MPWSKTLYLAKKEEVEKNIKTNKKSPFDYMVEYQDCVRKDELECCAAITDVLREYNHDTKETHKYIKQLQ